MFDFVCTRYIFNCVGIKIYLELRRLRLSILTGSGFFRKSIRYGQIKWKTASDLVAENRQSMTVSGTRMALFCSASIGRDRSDVLH